MRWLALMMALGLAGCGANSPSAPVTTPSGASSQAAGQASAPPAARRPSAPSTWRVTQAATTGCADPAALRILRQEAVGAEGLRSLAAARVSGGCVTVFPGQAWRLLDRGDQTVRLSPTEGGGGPLWFWRDQVTEER